MLTPPRNVMRACDQSPMGLSAFIHTSTLFALKLRACECASAAFMPRTVTHAKNRRVAKHYVRCDVLVVALSDSTSSSLAVRRKTPAQTQSIDDTNARAVAYRFVLEDTQDYEGINIWRFNAFKSTTAGFQCSVAIQWPRDTAETRTVSGQLRLTRG